MLRDILAHRNCAADYISILRVYDWIIGILFPPRGVNFGKGGLTLNHLTTSTILFRENGKQQCQRI